MQTLKKLKNELKACNKAYTFKTTKHLSIGFKTINEKISASKSALTTIQYLKNPLALIFNKQQVKFPVETNLYNFNFHLNGMTHKKNDNFLSFFKILNAFIVSHETLLKCKFNQHEAYFNLGHVTLNSINLIPIFNGFRK